MDDRKMSDLKVSWECPANIALVKYWGKKPHQLPINPSLSFSLKKSRTCTSVQLQPITKNKVQFLLKGKASLFGLRIEKYLHELSLDLPWINDYSFLIKSDNTFPHSAGIASSASAFGALGLCLTDINQQLTGKEISRQQFFQDASRVARLGSGSASRSVYPAFAWWGKSSALNGSTDCFALPVQNTHDSYSRLYDAILLVDSSKKPVSSSEGHELMNKHFYREARIKQANKNAEQLLAVMKTSSHFQFFEIIENEAMSLHALMLSSLPSYILLKPASLQIIDKIRDFREQSKLPVGFTIDAGPNIHLLYFEEHRREVHQFIKTELLTFLEDGKWLDDRVGSGPDKLI